jgi:hypothetical protein
MTPLATGRTAETAAPQRTRVFSLIGVVLLTLVAFSAFFVGFLLAPLAVLLFFSLIFYARNRSGSGKPGPTPPEEQTSGGARARLISEARTRQAALAADEQRRRAYEDVGGKDDTGDLAADAVSRETD